MCSEGIIGIGEESGERTSEEREIQRRSGWREEEKRRLGVRRGRGLLSAFELSSRLKCFCYVDGVNQR